MRNTEIAKITKSGIVNTSPSSRSSYSGRWDCLEGKSHTEIAKVAKTDLELGDFTSVVGRSFVIFAISV